MATTSSTELRERIERTSREWHLADQRGDEYTAAALWLKLEVLKKKLRDLQRGMAA